MNHATGGGAVGSAAGASGGVQESGQDQPDGFVPHRKVRAWAFATLVFAIAVAVVGGLLVVWDLATQDTLWRLLASAGLLVAGVAAFAMVNTMFGSRQPGDPKPGA